MKWETFKECFEVLIFWAAIVIMLLAMIGVFGCTMARRDVEVWNANLEPVSRESTTVVTWAKDFYIYVDPNTGELNYMSTSQEVNAWTPWGKVGTER